MQCASAQLGRANHLFSVRGSSQGNAADFLEQVSAGPLKLAKTIDLKIGEQIMDEHDLKFMMEAIKWANACQSYQRKHPQGWCHYRSGKRSHRLAAAEVMAKRAMMSTPSGYAIQDVKVKDKSRLSSGDALHNARTLHKGKFERKPLECCTELIRQHQIQKVFIGILDPNQGVTGKGLWRLQDTGVEVALFPHELSKEIRVQNAAFIRSQQTLGATIVGTKRWMKNSERMRLRESIPFGSAMRQSAWI